MEIKKIDKYKIIKLLGTGSMGKVYLAKDEKNQKSFAVKILKESFKLSREEAIIRFKREAEIVKNLSHPNVIKLHSVSLQDDIYIVMEYFQGSSLRLFGEQIGFNKKIEIIKQITDALIYIHSNGIIHQDLKPENILVKNNGEIQTRIIDFGLSHFINLQKCIIQNNLIGTLGYISPEQTGLLKRNVDNRSDLYSLGVIFYELLTGRLPFVEKDISKLLYCHLAKIPEKPSNLNEEIPEIYDEIILKLLNKEPAERYQSAKTLLADLDTINKINYNNFLIGEKDIVDKINYQVKPVGQKEELSKLGELFNSIGKKEPAISLISGKSGAGKSLLTENFKETSLDNESIFLSFKCLQTKENTPYLPFYEILNTYFGKHFNPKNKKSISKAVGDRAGMLINVFNFLDKFLKKTEKGEKWILEGPSVKQELFTGITDLLTAIGNLDKKIIIFIDDVQWADNDSVMLLNYLSMNLEKSKILIILTIREEECNNVNINLMDTSNIFYHIKLQPLVKKDIKKLIEKILNSKNKLSEIFYNKIYEISLGNPLTVIEIIKTLHKNKILYVQEHEWQIDDNKVKNFSFETKLENLLLERLTEFNEEELNILSIISVIGKEFTLELLNKLIEDDRHSIEKLIPVIDKAIEQQIMVEDLSKEKGTYYFIHDKIKETLYKRLNEKDKKRLHLVCAKTYENKFNSGEQNAIYSTAFHYNKTDETEKMLNYNDIAYKNAISQHATGQAIYYLKIIADFFLDNKLLNKENIQLLLLLAMFLQFESNLAESLQYLEKGLNISKKNKWHDEEINFLFNIGASYCWIKQSEKGWEYLSEGYKIANKYNISIKEENTFRSIGLVMLDFRNINDAITFLTEVISNIDKDNKVAMVYSLAARACNYSYACKFELALKDLKKIEETLKLIDNQIVLCEIYHVISWAYSFILKDNGKHALKHSAEANKIAEKINHKIILWATYSTQQTVNYFKKNYNKTLEMIEKQDELSKKYNIQFFNEAKYGFSATCFLWQEKINTLLKYINKIEKENVIIVDTVPRSLMFKVKASIAYIKGDLEECLKILNEAHEFSKANGILLFNHFNLYLRSKVFKLTGNEKESIKAYEELNKILTENPGQELYLLRVTELMEIIERLKRNYSSNISYDRPVRDALALQNIIATSHKISSILELNKLISFVLEKAIELTGASRGTLLLYNEETGELEPKASIDINTDSDDFKIPRSIINEAEEKNVGIVYSFSKDGKIVSPSDSVIEQNIKSVLCLPIKYQNKTLGFLYMDSNLLEKLFTESHLNLIKVFSAQVAVSIDNARAYELVENEKSLLDNKVQEKTKELKNLLIMKNNFIAMVNHDLKNIFGAILGASGFLLKENLTNKQKSYIEIINKSTKMVLKLANDFLQIALFESGKISILKQRENISELIEDVVLTFNTIAKTKNIEIEYKALDKIFINIDKEKIYTVLSNLVSNALKFTKNKISIILEKSDKNVIIKVIDNGIGIKPERIKEIFIPFITHHDEDLPSEDKGSGLGLSICQKIIKLHDGEIEVESQPGKGSNFTCKLPIKN